MLNSYEYLRKDIEDETMNNLSEKFSELVINKVVNAPWVPGAKEFLDKYYNRIDLYVVSGTPQDELIEINKRRNIDYCFKGIYGSPKKKGELALNVLNTGNYKKENVVFIGDSVTDLEGAEFAGVGFIGRIESENSHLNTINGFKKIKNLWELESVLF